MTTHKEVLIDDFVIGRFYAFGDDHSFVAISDRYLLKASQNRLYVCVKTYTDKMTDSSGMIIDRSFVKMLTGNTLRTFCQYSSTSTKGDKTVSQWYRVT